MSSFNNKLALFVVAILIILSQMYPQTSFKVGDIIFQDLDCGPPCDAIEAVTSGYNGAQLSHCGIITEIQGKEFSQIFVIEAIGDGVIKTYYCSEVIYKGFEMADSTQNLFAINPMTFNEPNTDTPFVHWVSYYEELNAEIPEGKPGLNPGGISQSDKIDIIYTFNKPNGMR